MEDASKGYHIISTGGSVSRTPLERSVEGIHPTFDGDVEFFMVNGRQRLVNYLSLSGTKEGRGGKFLCP